MSDQVKEKNEEKVESEEQSLGREDFYNVPQFNVKVTVYKVSEGEDSHRHAYNILLHDLDQDKTIVFYIHPGSKGKYEGWELGSRAIEEEIEEMIDDGVKLDLSEVLKKLLAKE